VNVGNFSEVNAARCANFPYKYCFMDLFSRRYIVIKKLGWGHFSTVWMVKDRKLAQQQQEDSNAESEGHYFYALKVQKSAEHYTEAAIDEVELLDCIASERKKVESSLLGTNKDPDAAQMVEHSRYVATLHDSFFHSGPNGRHMCMVFGMLGCNLLSVIKAHNYRGIPLQVVKKMTKGVCMGLDFLHRKCRIIHTDLKPENVLLQFPHQIHDPVDDLAMTVAAMAMEDSATTRNTINQSIHDLEDALKDPKISRDEKKKLRKRLKKKRQKERKRTFGQPQKARDGADSSDDEDGGDDDDDEDDDHDDTEGTDRSERVGMLSDFEMGKILSKAAGMISGSGGTANSSSLSAASPTGGASADARKRRLGHSPFVSTNFGPHREPLDTLLTTILKEKVQVSHSETGLDDCGDIASMSLLLRAVLPGQVLADAISAAFGVPAQSSTVPGSTSNIWKVSLTVPGSEIHQPTPVSSKQSVPDVETVFELEQHLDDIADEDTRLLVASLSTLVEENLSKGRDPGDTAADSEIAVIPDVPSMEASPTAMFTLRFPERSTYTVLGFVENRIPGIVFMSYGREEAVPPLDTVVFGPFAERLCNHSLAMRVKSTGSETDAGTCLFGFDLRLVSSFDYRSETDEPALAFDLKPETNEKVYYWWQARNPLQDRMKAFTGVDPVGDMTVFGHEDEREARRSSATDVTDAGFHEGIKKASTAGTMTSEASTTAPSSRDTSASSAARSASHQPDLKDTDMLMNCRTVIVDLGNGCWTHRHFSEDIQTRQYRAPEVLIGSSYDTSADIWSLGCMTFELLTGDLLFDPRAGEDYDRDEDHLAMFQELLGKIPKKIALDGKYSKNFFDKRGNLKRIKQLKFWPVQDVLTEKYHFSKEDAQAVADFMVPLLDFDPKTRATALDALKSDWLADV